MVFFSFSSRRTILLKSFYRLQRLVEIRYATIIGRRRPEANPFSTTKHFLTGDPVEKEEPMSNPDTTSAAMQYIMTMLLQRLDATGAVKLDEMIAGVQSDLQACIDPTPAVQETFKETLTLLRFARNCGTGQ